MLSFDDSKINIARKPGKKRKENPLLLNDDMIEMEGSQASNRRKIREGAPGKVKVEKKYKRRIKIR